jgi:hypothetical protein
VDEDLAARLLEAERKLLEEEDQIRTLRGRAELAAQAGWVLVGPGPGRRSTKTVSSIVALGCHGVARSLPITAELWRADLSELLDSTTTDDQGRAVFVTDPGSTYKVKLVAADRYAAHTTPTLTATFTNWSAQTAAAPPYACVAGCSRPQNLLAATITVKGEEYTFVEGSIPVPDTQAAWHYDALPAMGGGGYAVGAESSATVSPIVTVATLSTGVIRVYVTWRYLSWYGGVFNQNSPPSGVAEYQPIADAADSTLASDPTGYNSAATYSGGARYQIATRQIFVDATATACDPLIATADFTGTDADTLFGITTVTIEAPPD